MISNVRSRGSRYRDKGTGWTIRGSNLVRGNRIYILKKVQTSSVAHPASYSIGVLVVSSRNTAGPQVNQLPPSSAENEWS